MKKAFLLVLILMVSIISTACINNLAVQELNVKAKEFMDKGDYESAIGRLKSSIDLDDSIFETHYNLGIAYTQAQEYESAVEEFEKALTLKPDADVVHYSLAVAYENQAKDIINPPVKEGEQIDTDDLEEEKELSLEDKQKIVELFNNSVDSYTKYLEKVNNEDVKAKIEYLQNEITKYSEQ